MDASTSACLAPTMPAKGSLKSVGGVCAMHERANAQTADNSDFGRFQKESDPLADDRLQTFGHEAYDKYIRDVAAQCQRKDAEKLARRTARTRQFLDVYARIERKLASPITNVASRIAQRQIAA